MARLYANENFPLPVVESLRQLGHDVWTVQESGLDAATDERVLSFATEQKRCVLTLNRKHFLRLHRESAAHAGIIVCTVDLDFVRQANSVDEAVRSMANLQGAMLRVNRPRT